MSNNHLVAESPAEDIPMVEPDVATGLPESMSDEQAPVVPLDNAASLCPSRGSEASKWATAPSLERTHAEPAMGNTLEDEIKILENRLTAAQWELIREHRKYSANYDNFDRTISDRLKSKIDWLVEQINSLKSSPKKSSDSHFHIRRISPSEVPRYQLVGQELYWPGSFVFSSVEHFLCTFENVIIASGNQLENVWKQYIVLAIPYNFNNWVRNDLLGCDTWVAARKLCLAHFGVKKNKDDALRRLYICAMKEGETLLAYTTRFVNLVCDAGYNKNDSQFAEKYRTSLLTRNQQLVRTLMESKNLGHGYNWSIEEIFEIAKTVYEGDDELALKAEKRKGAGSGNSASSYTSLSRKRSTGSGLGCPRHGGDTATHTDAECRSIKKSVMLGSNNKASRATGGQVSTSGASSAGSAARSNNCYYCNRAWSFGHKCEEYRLAKNKGRTDVQVHTVRKIADEDDSMSEGNAIAQVMQDAAFQCKSTICNERYNPFQLLTPIILEGKNGERVKLTGKIDSGSQVSCIDREVFLNKLNFSSLNIKSVDGSLLFISNKTKRIGVTEAIKLHYWNDISFDFSFEVVDFSKTFDFDVLLGTDILTRLNIGLTGVAHKYPYTDDLDQNIENEKKEASLFENLNFDIKNFYNPVTAGYGNESDQKRFRDHIAGAIKENQDIPLSACCSIPESIVKIPIKENASYYVKQYPLSYHSMPEIKRQLSEWLEAGIVEKARPSGRFNSPLLTVPKKSDDGKPAFRVCMDVRRINLHIPDTTDQFQVPLISEIFEKVTAKGKVFSKLDLKSAYHSFKVSEESQEVLSFMVGNECYRWKRCCFGLKHITSLFSRVMNILFHDIEEVEVYVDDLCCWSENIEDHAELVKKVIQRLSSANLKLNVEKCSFFRTSIYLLGMVIAPGITKIDTRRLSNIHEWKPCKTPTQVRQLMGVISHMRTHIPMINKLVAPIDQLRNDNDVEKNWTPLCTERLEAVKQILLSSLVLHSPDMNKKFYLETDACDYGIACILTQRADDGRTLYIAFLSKSLSPSQRNWPVLRRELYAILFGLVRLRPLLYGHPQIEVLTDHRALVYIYSCKYPNKIIQTYLEILDDYPQLTFTHIPGATHVLPDLLSRLYEPIDHHKELVGGDQDKKMKRLEQYILKRKGSQKEMFGSHKKIKLNKHNPSNNHIIKKTKIYNKDKMLNVLAIKIKQKDFKGVDYIAPPEEERDALLREAHAFGHDGSTSLVQRIHEQGIHWDNLYDDAKNVCKACIQCARHYVSRKGYHPLKNILAYVPFDHIGMDFLGPLPETINDNRYILVVVDLCTKFTIAKALPNKQSDTVAYALMEIYGNFGIPAVVQSDNGREFKNQVMDTISRSLGVEHRYSTAFHARGNGASESAVKNVLNTLRKMADNNQDSWDRILPATQLAINTRVINRTKTAPFALMYARPLNRFIDYNEPDVFKTHPNKPMTIGDLQKRSTYMSDIVFPAVKQRTLKLIQEAAKRFNKEHLIVDFQVGDWVMTRLPHRESKLEPAFEGPFQIVQKKSSTYVLKDEHNELLHRDYVPSELKLVSIDETAIEDEVFEVDEIRDHRGPPLAREYLVKWKGYGEKSNTWETAAAFNNPITIKKYWGKIKELERLEKERAASMTTDSSNQRSQNQRHVNNNNMQPQRQSRRLDAKKQ